MKLDERQFILKLCTVFFTVKVVRMRKLLPLVLSAKRLNKMCFLANTMYRCIEKTAVTHRLN